MVSEELHIARYEKRRRDTNRGHMKEITTTTVTTEVIRRAPGKRLSRGPIAQCRKRPDSRYGNVCSSTLKQNPRGRTWHKSNMPFGCSKKGQTRLIKFYGRSPATHSILPCNLAPALTTIRDGISEMATRSGMGLIDKDNRTADDYSRTTQRIYSYPAGYYG